MLSKAAALPVLKGVAIPREKVRAGIGGACGAAGITIYLTSPAINSWLAPLGFTLLLLSVVFIGVRRPSTPVLAGSFIIVGSAWLALLFAEHKAPTLLLAMLTSVLAPFIFLKSPDPVFQWTIPVWLLHASMSIHQWLGASTDRVTGLSSNANVGAAFLLLGCVWIINGHSRLRWLMLPLVMAIPFTGSRWVAGLAALAVFLVLAARVVNWRYLGVIVVAMMAIVLSVGWADLSVIYARESTLSVHIGGYDSQVNPALSWVPQGFTDNGIHIVPWRMMNETGVLSGLAWVGLTVWGLARKPDKRWWMLLTVALISLMYYNTWIGPLGMFWWMLINPRQGNTNSHPG